VLPRPWTTLPPSALTSSSSRTTTRRHGSRLAAHSLPVLLTRSLTKTEFDNSSRLCWDKRRHAPHCALYYHAQAPYSYCTCSESESMFDSVYFRSKKGFCSVKRHSLHTLHRTTTCSNTYQGVFKARTCHCRSLIPVRSSRPLRTGRCTRFGI